jgi:hypothetical protein
MYLFSVALVKLKGITSFTLDLPFLYCREKFQVFTVL